MWDAKKEARGKFNRSKLNEKSVREVVPEPGRDYQIFDSEVRGFASCIYRSGDRAFTLDYRHRHYGSRRPVQTRAKPSLIRISPASPSGVCKRARLRPYRRKSRDSLVRVDHFDQQCRKRVAQKRGRQR